MNNTICHYKLPLKDQLAHPNNGLGNLHFAQDPTFPVKLMKDRLGNLLKTKKKY